MRNLILLIAIALVSTPAIGATGATVRGQARLFKNGKPVAGDIWVYLEEVKHRHRKVEPGANVTAEIKQKNKQFDPHIVVVPVGATVWFPNTDHEDHNVFSPTDPPGQFDLGRYNNDAKGKSHRFDDVAQMEIFCDIHKEMWAVVKAVDSPYIAKVANGSFDLTGVAPGKYRVVAWALDGIDASKSDIIDVGEGQTFDVGELRIDYDPKNHAHMRKDGSNYTPY